MKMIYFTQHKINKIIFSIENEDVTKIKSHFEIAVS